MVLAGDFDSLAALDKVSSAFDVFRHHVDQRSPFVRVSGYAASQAGSFALNRSVPGAFPVRQGNLKMLPAIIYCAPTLQRVIVANGSCCMRGRATKRSDPRRKNAVVAAGRVFQAGRKASAARLKIPLILGRVRLSKQCRRGLSVQR